MNTKYKDFFENIDRSLNHNQLSHAYLLEIIDQDDQLDIALEMAKKILTFNRDDKAEIINQIDHNICEDLKIIKTDGQFIKKEQIIEIQNQFSTKSLTNNKRVYIIENATKLNKSSANTLLKFLEEPNDDIVAILLTQNKYSIIPTILSRCMCITIKSKDNTTSDVEDAIKFINLIEKYKIKSLPYIEREFSDTLEEKEKLSELLQKCMLVYSDLIYLNFNLENYLYTDNKQLKDVNIDNDYLINASRIKVISKCIEYLNYNINYKVLVDKLISMMFGDERYV